MENRGVGVGLSVDIILADQCHFAIFARHFGSGSVGKRLVGYNAEMKLRPRFSLRILFVLTTLIAIGLGWLAWQRRVVVERERLMNDILESWHGRYYYFGDVRANFTPSSPHIPWWRELLGDHSYGWILLPEDCDEDLVSRAMKLFAGEGVYRRSPQNLPHEYYKLD
jgi:hypothetical protein